ncbi:MAG TPA: phospholipase D-like domain-containing protein [Nocardioides sp.]|nr:phospholipase D-like domain-containing protein [Nocardioides sp.]
MTLTTVSPAAAWEPVEGPVFNNPWGKTGARWKVVNHVLRAVESAPAGSRVLISSFLFDGKRAGDALVRARNRGVAVQVVFDGDDAVSPQARRVARHLNRDNVKAAPAPAKWGPDNSFVVHCKGSCRAGSANNHAKFYVFTRTGSARDVVMVSSSNLNKGGATKGWNDLYVAKSRPQMVEQYTSIHAEMAQDSPSDGDGYRELTSGPFTSRFYPKRRGGDPVMADLSKVSCRGATDGAGVNGRTAINVSMFAWNADRGERIARRLVRLDQLGCEVSVIYGAPSKIVRNILRDSARRGQIKLWDSRYDRNGDGIFDARVHHKYMLINGVYGNDRSAWRVHTGSQNWGRGTLRGGDENTLTVVSRGAYARYMDNWRFVRDVGARRIGR